MVSLVAGLVVPRVTTAERDANFSSVQSGFVIYNTDVNSLEVTNDNGATWQQSATMQDIDLISLNKAYESGEFIDLDLNNPVQINTLIASGPSSDSHTAADGLASNVNDRIEGFTFVPTVSIQITALTYTDVDFTLPGTRTVEIYRKSDQALMVTAAVAKTDPLVNGFRVNSSVTIITSNKLELGIEYALSVVVPATETYLNTTTATDPLINVTEQADGPDTSTPQFPANFIATADSPKAGGFQFQQFVNEQNYVWDNEFFSQKFGSTTFNAGQGSGEFIINGSTIVSLFDVNYGTEEVRVNGITRLQEPTYIDSFLRVNTNAATDAFVIDYDNDRISILPETRFLSLSINSLAFIGPDNQIATATLTGDITNSANVTTLATVNSNVGTFGDADNVAQVTVNEKGLITAVSDIPINFSVASQDLDMNNFAISNVSLINGIQPTGGLFMQTADGPLLTASTTETSLLSSGEGSLTIPADYFGLNSFMLNVGGYLDAVNGDTLTLRIKSNGSIDLGVIVITLSNATSRFFELEADFTIRSAGVATVSEVVTNFDFTYNINAGNTYDGQRGIFKNNTTFDTTISNTLSITGQFNSANIGNSIQTVTAQLNRIY